MAEFDPKYGGNQVPRDIRTRRIAAVYNFLLSLDDRKGRMSELAVSKTEISGSSGEAMESGEENLASHYDSRTASIGTQGTGMNEEVKNA